MKITQEVSEFAAVKELDEAEASPGFSCGYTVEEMEDGRMGSLRFGVANNTLCHFGKQL
jgi:hypothetical protein